MVLLSAGLFRRHQATMVGDSGVHVLLRPLFEHLIGSQRVHDAIELARLTGTGIGRKPGVPHGIDP